MTFGPFLLDHTLRWNEGKFTNSLALLADLSGMPEILLRQIRYPDVDRVFSEFLMHVPGHVRDAINAGEIPLPRIEVNADAEPPQADESAILEPQSKEPFNPVDPWDGLPKEQPTLNPLLPPADLENPPAGYGNFGFGGLEPEI